MQKKTVKKRLLDAPWSPKCLLHRFLLLFDGFWFIFGWFVAPKPPGQTFQKQPLGQIVPKTTSGTNRSKNNLWDKSFQKQRLGQALKKTLGQIVPTTISGTNRSRRTCHLGPTNKFSPPSPLKKRGPGVLPAKRLNPRGFSNPSAC